MGGSEEKIRKLFEPAEKDMKEKGDESDLHVIIFDEIDAICFFRIPSQIHPSCNGSPMCFTERRVFE